MLSTGRTECRSVACSRLPTSEHGDKTCAREASYRELKSYVKKL